MGKDYQFLIGFLIIPAILFFVPISIIYLTYTKLRYKNTDWTFYRNRKFWRFFLVSYILSLIGTFVFVFILNGVNMC